jgi:hypothetical protein
MRNLVLFLVLALIPQEPPKPAPPCDLAKIEDALWCSKCKKAREKDQIVEEKCKVCQGPLDKLKVCVKEWIPRCGMHMAPHLDNCCKSKQCCKHEIVKVPVGFRCEGCGAFALEEAKIAHDPKEHPPKAVRSCEGSGSAPHGGEPIK